MYAPDTILKLKKPRDPDPETDEEFPYNRVRVIGQSPVTHAGVEEWEGGDAAGVIITPISNFGSVLDEPFGKLQALYDVESLPEPVEEVIPVLSRVVPATTPGPTPEEVFAKEAPGKAPNPGERRARSPLGEDPRPSKNDGPLGHVTKEEANA